MKDGGNETGISQNARTFDAGLVRTFAGRGEIATQPQVSQTGYEPAGDNCQVLPPLLFPNQLNLVAGVEFSCLSTHRTSKVSSVFSMLWKRVGIPFMQGSVSSRPSLEEVISLVLAATLRTASPSSWKLTASTLHQSPRSEHPAMMKEPRTDASLLLEVSSGNCSRGDRGVRFVRRACAGRVVFARLVESQEKEATSKRERATSENISRSKRMQSLGSFAAAGI